MITKIDTITSSGLFVRLSAEKSEFVILWNITLYVR